MKSLRNIIGLFAFVLLTGQQTRAQQPCFLTQPTPWADSLLQTLSLEEKIGQLFMIAAWSDPKHKEYNPTQVANLIEQYHIGGIIFMQGSPGRQAILTNRYQSKSKIPLMLAMDAEWGLGMRLDSTISFPRQLTLGATCNDSLIYAFGKEMSYQLKRLGVNVSFSPVVDINNNPKNPVISNRSFGENKHLVTAQSLMYMKGLQDNGILACAKHFPGHGDTDTDSHKTLPVVMHGCERLDTLELFPYKKLFSEGLGSVMTAHLYVPSLDSTPNLACTLSPKIISDLLRDTLQFKGLVFTDAMNMQGVAKYYEPGDVEVMALMAGNDVLLFSQDIPLAIQKIKSAIDSGWISMKELDQHCYRILQTKEWSGLTEYTPIKVSNIANDLNNANAENIRRLLIEQSITVLKNDDNVLPLNNTSGKRIAVVNIGVEKPNEFNDVLDHYLTFDSFVMDKNPDFKKSIWWRDTLSTYDIVIAGMLNTSNRPSKNFGVTNESARILNSVGAESKVILTVFANPYALEVLKDLSNIKSIIIAFQDEQITHKAAAEILVGALSANGSLPVTATAQYEFAAGLATQGGEKLRWANEANLTGHTISSIDNVTAGSPAGDYEEDMMGETSNVIFKNMEGAFSRIDAIAESGITKGAYPGCRVLVAKDGVVVLDKAYGTLDAQTKIPVDLNSVYDLASITKIASSTLCAMKLTDEGKLDVNKTLGDYLDIPSDNPYSKVVIKNMLSHCAGFTPWIPFYSKTIKDGQLDTNIYSSSLDSAHHNQVCDGLYIMDTYRDSIFNRIISTPLSAEKTYKYSDLGYYFIQRIVEKQTGQTLDAYIQNNFYTPMGLSSIGYKPLSKMSKNNIAPTENDKTFRLEHLQGYVHDQGAAMMGGVAGHAGLFSTAQDLAAVMQMLLNGGSYNGTQYISKATFDLFNTRHFSGNRRGLGFDKPSLTPGTGSTCRAASALSFGHTGFTGTMCWADPSNGLVYIFLSNRVNPDAENKKLQDLSIRTEIQEEIYKAFE